MFCYLCLDHGPNLFDEQLFFSHGKSDLRYTCYTPQYPRQVTPYHSLTP
jgi:hypothetical protein